MIYPAPQKPSDESDHDGNQIVIEEMKKTVSDGGRDDRQNHPADVSPTHEREEVTAKEEFLRGA